ncbi:ROK family protein [Nanoarchaeota archaeon]
MLIGVDVGGTNISAGRVVDDSLEGTVLSVPTKSHGKEQEVIEQITRLVDHLRGEDKLEAIGIGVPTFVDDKQGIVYDTTNIPSWKEVQLKKILEEKYGIPVYVNNDANCFALGEHYFGHGKNHKNIVGVTLGTGLGSGIIINSKLYTGTNCAAGELGEMVINDNKRLQSYCSGEFFKDDNPKLLAKKAREEDPAAIADYEKFGNNLGIALSYIVLAYDPEIIILGGSIAKSHDVFENAMKETLKESIPKRIYDKLQIKVSENENMGVLGAAALHYDAQE